MSALSLSPEKPTQPVRPSLQEKASQVPSVGPSCAVTRLSAPRPSCQVLAVCSLQQAAEMLLHAEPSAEPERLYQSQVTSA